MVELIFLVEWLCGCHIDGAVHFARGFEPALGLGCEVEFLMLVGVFLVDFTDLNLDQRQLLLRLVSGKWTLA